MNNVDKIFKLIIDSDESLSGSCWEELHYSYLDTPKDIVDDVIQTYMNNDIFGIEDVTETDKKLALAKYFQYVADILNINPDNILMKSENDMIISCLKYLPFNITALETNNDDGFLRYNMTISTTYGYNVIYVEFSKDKIIENKQKENGLNSKSKYLYMVAKAIEKEYDQKLEALLDDDNEENIRTAIIIHARISLLVDQLDNGELVIN